MFTCFLTESRLSFVLSFCKKYLRFKLNCESWIWVKRFKFTKKLNRISKGPSFIYHDHHPKQFASSARLLKSRKKNFARCRFEKSVFLSWSRESGESSDKPSDASSSFNEQTALRVAQHSNGDDEERNEKSSRSC